jgi:KaiC/GvpD/RAD55 family RecA-like ATPase
MVIQLRFEVSDDELHRSLVIRKARGCRHSPRVHDLRIGDSGIAVTVRSSTTRGPP